MKLILKEILHHAHQVRTFLGLIYKIEEKYIYRPAMQQEQVEIVLIHLLFTFYKNAIICTVD